MSMKKATGRGGVVRELITTTVPGISRTLSIEALIVNDTPRSIARKTTVAVSRRVAHSVTGLPVSRGFTSFQRSVPTYNFTKKTLPKFVGSFMYSFNARDGSTCAVLRVPRLLMHDIGAVRR